jgi:mRNA-degrading endonuclease RelE of RelBE toxin-antitoxin system
MEGCHRIRVGRIRMILKVDFKEQIVFMDRIDYRERVYK